MTTCRNCQVSKLCCIPLPENAGVMTKSKDSTSALPTDQSVANEKRREEGGGSLRKGEKCKRVRRVLAKAASAEEVETALVGRVAGLSRQRKADTSIQVFKKQIRDLLEAVRMSLAEIWDAINANTLAVRERNSRVEELQATVSEVADTIAQQSSMMQELHNASKKGKGKEVADAPEESEGKGSEEGMMRTKMVCQSGMRMPPMCSHGLIVHLHFLRTSLRIVSPSHTFVLVLILYASMDSFCIV